MFRSATLKLTLYYLAIVMIISLGFSAVLYHDASNELSGRLRDQYRQWHFALRYFDNNPDTPAPAPPSFTDELNSSRHHLILQLAYFNVLVLASAGFASYALARRTLRPIEEAHEQQKRFTADVSHELRTPLTALKMESEVALLDHKASLGTLRKTLSSNLEEANKLELLINNLLRLSRLETEHARESFQTVQLGTICSEAMTGLQPIADKRGITLQADLQAASVHGDATSLMQLITIVLDNAIKYSSNNSAVEISLLQTERHSIVSVIDHGIGIERAALPHIFDRFYRANKARNKTSNEAGFGLGLSLAKMIVDLHGGTINLRSKPGQGTTAVILLPKV
jgi:two-component system sensor histidine kinase CiaH